MLTRVTLTLNISVEPKFAWNIENHIQYTKAKHAHHIGLLSQGKIQIPELPQGKNHDNYIKQHVDCCGRPSLRIDVIAFIIPFAIPVQPRSR